MPSKEDIRRWAGQSSQPSRQPLPSPPPQQAPSPPTLPPLPSGWAYQLVPGHGYIPVQVAAPQPIVQAPGTTGVIHPGFGMPAVTPARANGVVLPFKRQSCQLVRGGVDRNGRPVDPYAEFLSGQPDLVPGMPGTSNELFAELIPSEEDEAQIHRPVAYHDQTIANEDPALDAYGARGPRTSVRIAPLKSGGGG